MGADIWEEKEEMIKRSLSQRFWGKVDRSGECWVWTGALTGPGYGQITVSGRKKTAHRLSWEAYNGPAPKGMFVCHKCDNRACVNPAHLFLGTHADNMADMARKGRSYHGEKHHWAKLSTDDVDEIRRFYSNGTPQKVLAREFGVTQGAISQIVNNLTRKKIKRKAA